MSNYHFCDDEDLKFRTIKYVCKIQYLHTKVHDIGVSKMMPIMMTGLMISQAAVVRWPSHWSSDLPNVNSDPEVPPTLARRKVVIINPWNFYFRTNTTEVNTAKLVLFKLVMEDWVLYCKLSIKDYVIFIYMHSGEMIQKFPSFPL